LLPAYAQKTIPAFKVIVLYENGGHHLAYSKTAIKWLNQLATSNQFAIDYIQKTDFITTNFLSKYRLFIQLDYPPYGWTKTAAAAFEDYIQKGKGGWIGFHHATLLGNFDGYPMWLWFSRFMGNIKFENYISSFADGQVSVEDKQHPVMRGLPAIFKIAQEEWYTYNQSPRQHVHVLASVNESGYHPQSSVKMGDHPVIWTNPHVKARNVYIFMGHSPLLFNNNAYKTLFSNAIFWAAGAKR
jgi:type 1 glutamine amidotransferase